MKTMSIYIIKITYDSALLSDCVDEYKIKAKDKYEALNIAMNYFKKDDANECVYPYKFMKSIEYIRRETIVYIEEE